MLISLMTLFDALDSLCNLGSALDLGLTIHKSAELDFTIARYDADIRNF